MRTNNIFQKGLMTMLLLVVKLCLAHGQGSVPDQVEFAALKDLYDNLGGSAWTTKTNWPTPGNWPASATVAEMDAWHGINVANGDIVTIQLNGNNLVGSIPSSIANLSALTYLDLSDSKFPGPIPSALGSLTA